MENLHQYIAFDMEFNTVNNISHIIQLSAVKFINHKEIAHFDSYVHSEVPLQSFISGLTGITSPKINQAPNVNTVLSQFKEFVDDFFIIGYNSHQSDLPILKENGLDLSEQYKVDVYDEAYARRSNDLNGILNLRLQSVANFLEIKGRGHDSLEDARMTALIYEKFLEFDNNKNYLNDHKETHGNNPFASLEAFFED